MTTITAHIGVVCGSMVAPSIFECNVVAL